MNRITIGNALLQIECSFRSLAQCIDQVLLPTAQEPVSPKPFSQRGSRLWCLPAELRNVVYAYLFDDGKKANANFLLTCRQARWEAGLLFVRSVTFRTSLHSADRRALIQQDVPTSHRKAITSVHREKFVFDFWSMAFNCHAVGIFPTEASVDVDWHRCHDQGRRQLPHHFQNMLYLARNTETGQEGVECGPFGEWLDNPRLLRWRVRQIDEFGLCKWEIKGTRVDARGDAVPDEPKADVPYETSVRCLPTSKWMQGLRLDVVKENPCGHGFVVNIWRVENDGAVAEGPVWVRFELLRGPM